MGKIFEEAIRNLMALGKNPYPGDGITVGMDDTGKKLVQIYWIMGIKEDDRNRKFEKDKFGNLWTVPVDREKAKNIFVYPAMREDRVFLEDGLYVVGNGLQTDAIIEEARSLPLNYVRKVFYNALSGYSHYPDPPFTPRITSICFLSPKPFAEMAIFKKSLESVDTEHKFYPFSEFTLGTGYCLTTYEGPGNPLLASKGSPYILPLSDGIEKITRDFWDVLDFDNRISLATKFIDIATGKSEIRIINAY